MAVPQTVAVLIMETTVALVAAEVVVTLLLTAQVAQDNNQDLPVEALVAMAVLVRLLQATAALEVAALVL